MKIFRTAILAIALLGLGSVASASTIWTLNNVNLTGPLGSITANGSFLYNGTTITDWDILLTNGDHYVKAGPPNQSVGFTNTSAFYFAISDVSGFKYIALALATPLVDTAPTNISLLGQTNASLVVTYGSNTFTCNSPCSWLAPTAGGYLSSTSVSRETLSAPVPEPATLGLMGIGLVGLAVRLRTRRA